MKRFISFFKNPYELSDAVTHYFKKYKASRTKIDKQASENKQPAAVYSAELDRLLKAMRDIKDNNTPMHPG
jgi:hypothetical protein